MSAPVDGLETDVRRDDGFSLIELLAASMLFAVIFTVIGSIFVSLIQTQATVDSVTTSSSTGQIAASSIENGIRNSSEFDLTAVGSDQLLVARTAGSGTTLTWYCTAWYYSAAGEGSIRMRTTTGVAIGTPTSAQLATWTLLLEGVEPRTGTTIFSAAGPQLTVSFDATADDTDNATAIEFTAVPLTGTSEASTCY
jgi:prepilin-type N-terminal cleavage/methylation domain-containing protein